MHAGTNHFDFSMDLKICESQPVEIYDNQKNVHSFHSYVYTAVINGLRPLGEKKIEQAICSHGIQRLGLYAAVAEQKKDSERSEINLIVDVRVCL